MKRRHRTVGYPDLRSELEKRLSHTITAHVDPTPDAKVQSRSDAAIWRRLRLLPKWSSVSSLNSNCAVWQKVDKRPGRSPGR